MQQLLRLVRLGDVVVGAALEAAHDVERVRQARDQDHGDGAVEITFLGERFLIESGKEQVLDLLISSFEELIRSNQALRASEAERARQLAREREARAQAEAISRRLRLLHGVSDAAVADSTLDEFLATVLQLVRTGLATDTVSVLLLDDATQELVVHASVGLEAAVAAGTRIPVGRGISGAIARARDTAVVEDVASAPEVVSEILRRRVRSMVGAPLVTGRAVLGVLHVGTRAPRHFLGEDVALLRLVADRVALFIERVRLHERERAARRDAEDARLRAEAANRAKSDFLAMMSHDLRTTLNAIGGYAELMEMGLRGPVTPEQLKDLDRIKQNQRILLGLLNQLLNISRIERGQVPLHVEALDVTTALESVLTATRPQVDAKGLQLQLRPPPEALTVRADAERLEQVLLNLLTNAIKFTPPGGVITVSCTPEDGSARFAVSDTGIGIPADKLETIFDPFVQVDSRRIGEQQGVGLGLSISRSLVQLMGGELSVQTEVGKGSTFCFTLPRAVSAG